MIRKCCWNLNKTINNYIISQTSFLTIDDFGKTYKEIGFDFIPK